MALLYTVVSPFLVEDGGAGHSGCGGTGHAEGGAVSGAPLVHYCTRVGFVQGALQYKEKEMSFNYMYFHL